MRNIYSSADFEEMNIGDIEKYYEGIDKLLELFPVVENALDDGDMFVEFKDVMLEDLDDACSTLSELKEDMDHVVVAKKRFASKPNFSDKIKF